MMVGCQAIRPQNAHEYRRHGRSVFLGSDPTHGRTAGNSAESSEASAFPLQLVLSRNTYERIAAAKRAQDGLIEQVKAEAVAVQHRQYEELRALQELRESSAREEREREENLRQQRLEDIQQRVLAFETARAIKEEERNAEIARRIEAETQARHEARRRRQAEQDRILAEQIAEEEARQAEQDRILAEQIAEEEARLEEERRRTQEAEERERIRRERLRECAACMEEEDMGSMTQAPCTHWYCHEHLQSKIHQMPVE